MGDISANFSRWEFACRCGCGFDAVDVKLLEILEAVRNHYNLPVYVNCGCRCLNHNRSIGSEDSSQHVRGLAVDSHIEGISPEAIAFWIEERFLQGTGGIGIYIDVPSRYNDKLISFIHIDVRQKMARWRKEGKEETS